jgi:hypothetical protein
MKPLRLVCVAESAYNGSMDFRRAVAVFVLAAFAFAGGFGVLHVGMDMDASGSMSACPFMGMTALCQMTPLEHIEAWQGMFTSLPWSAGAAALAFVLLVFLGLASAAGVRIRPVCTEYQALQCLRRREYAPPTNPLQELFSNGILNPKYF